MISKTAYSRELFHQVFSYRFLRHKSIVVQLHILHNINLECVTINVYVNEYESNMNISSGSENDFAQTLMKYRRLTMKPENHVHLLKEKTAILFTASVLELNDLPISTLCLDIFQDLVENSDTHASLITTFGIFEALESSSIRLRGIDINQSQRAAELADILRRNAPPAYSTRTRIRNRQQIRNATSVFQLYLPHLTDESRRKFEEVIIKIKGVVSFVVDLKQQKCTLRLTPKLCVNDVIKTVFDKTAMKALLVTKNRNDINEIYVDILNETNRKGPKFEYYPEEESPPKGKSLTNMKTKNSNSIEWYKTATDFLAKSFYW